jgi:hypothetical protein
LFDSGCTRCAMDHIPISNSDLMSPPCPVYIVQWQVSSMYLHEKTAYFLLSFQYRIGSFVGAIFITSNVCHSNTFLAAARDFFVLGIVLVRICMQRDHYVKYGVLFGRAGHKGEAVSKTGLSNNSNNGANDPAGQRPHPLGQSRSTA